MSAEDLADLSKKWAGTAAEAGFVCKYLLIGPAWKIGFCSLHYDPLSKQPFFDPVKILVGAGWTDAASNER